MTHAISRIHELDKFFGINTRSNKKMSLLFSASIKAGQFFFPLCIVHSQQPEGASVI